jgi:hypothetical protein
VKSPATLTGLKAVGGASWENNLPHTPPEESLSRVAIKENKILFLDIFRHLREKLFQLIWISRHDTPP